MHQQRGANPAREANPARGANPARDQTGFGADVAHVCAVEAVGELDHGVVVNVARLGNGLRVDLENL